MLKLGRKDKPKLTQKTPEILLQPPFSISIEQEKARDEPRMMSLSVQNENVPGGTPVGPRWGWVKQVLYCSKSIHSVISLIKIHKFRLVTLQK